MSINADRRPFLCTNLTTRKPFRPILPALSPAQDLFIQSVCALSAALNHKRGVGSKEAEHRAWATVNKETGGGKKSGSGRGHKTSTSSSKKGGEKGGHASASRSAAERSTSAKKAAATRKRNAAKKSH
jgi:hypothetical protein